MRDAGRVGRRRAGRAAGAWRRAGRRHRRPAEHVVVCAGVWSAMLGGLSADQLVPLRPVKGQILRAARPGRAGSVDPRDPDRPVVHHAARRRALRDRRDLGGARVRSDRHGGGDVRAAARRVRARPRRLGADRRRADRGPATGDARQPARDRAGAGRRWPVVGGRASARRDPAVAGDRAADRRRDRGRERRAAGVRPRPVRGALGWRCARGSPGQERRHERDRQRRATGAARRRYCRQRAGAARCRADARGIAVAVDGEVVPRSRWDATALRDGSAVEVVAAIGGG